MNILLLGGTGAMGIHLSDILSQNKNKCYITTRSYKKSTNNIKYLIGNAKDDYSFFHQVIISKMWDCIVDFLAYESLADYKNRVEVILKHTKQFVMISSCRVYSDAKGLVTEETPRLIDVNIEDEYLNSNEYAINKCREENIVFDTESLNWTIVRPYITFGEDRFQLGVFEKERWLFRALNHKSIVFSEDIAKHRTTITYGKNVAEGIAFLIGNSKAFGECFNITSEVSYTWDRILKTYCNIIKEKLGYSPNIVLQKESEFLDYGNPWALKYDRYLDRTFSSAKMRSIGFEIDKRDPLVDLSECFMKFLSKRKRWGYIDYRQEAKRDKILNEWSSLNKIEGKKNKLIYFFKRIGF